MTLGHSGAKISFLPHGFVRKSGGSMNLWAQARLCQELGTVCPSIVVIGRDDYVMERLHEYDPADCSYFTLADEIRVLLETKVWDIEAPPEDQLWRPRAKEWMKIHAPWLSISCFDYLHSQGPLEFSMTHGDPTFANVMIRPVTGSLVLIDPAPPRPGIPWLRYVDMGKLLQSAAGWEHVLEPAWPNPPVELVGHILRAEQPYERARCLFWAAFHCARIVARTTIPAAKSWGMENSIKFMEEADRVIRL